MTEKHEVLKPVESTAKPSDLVETKEAMAKDFIIEVIIDDVFRKSEGSLDLIIQDLDKILPPNFKFKGVTVKGRSTKAKPTHVLVLGVTLETLGKALIAFQASPAKPIMIYDPYVDYFELGRYLNTFIVALSGYTLDRVGGCDEQEIFSKIQYVSYIKGAKEISRTLLALGSEEGMDLKPVGYVNPFDKLKEMLK